MGKKANLFPNIEEQSFIQYAFASEFSCSFSVRTSWWNTNTFFTHLSNIFILWLNGTSTGFHWIWVYGKPAKQSEAPILVGNHTSYIDALFLFYHDLPLSVAKSGVKKIPIIGDAISMITILVDRENSKSKACKSAKRISTKSYQKNLSLSFSQTKKKGNGHI